MKEGIISNGQGVPFESRTDVGQGTHTENRDIWSVSSRRFPSVQPVFRDSGYRKTYSGV